VISRDVGGGRGALGGQMGDKLVGRLAVLTVFRARFRARKSRCQEFSSASISVVTSGNNWMEAAREIELLFLEWHLQEHSLIPPSPQRS
jgi:hypothetical protein